GTGQWHDRCRRSTGLRPGPTPAARARPRYRPRAAGRCAVPAPDRRAECGFRAAWLAATATTLPDRRGVGPRLTGWVRSSQATRVVRGTTTAGGVGPRNRPQPGGRAARRTVLGVGRLPPRVV